MNRSEALEVAGRIRSAWTGSFMDDAMVDHWAEFLQQYSVEDATRALSILQRKQEKIPSQATFADIIEGEAAHRIKCPHCGLGFKTEARVQEHVSNVHWER